MLLKKVVVVLLSAALFFTLTGCGNTGQAAVQGNAPESQEAEPKEPSKEEEVKEEAAKAPSEETKEESEAAEETESGEDKIKKASELIDRIYSKEWTPETEGLCVEAREAWNALTDEEKEQVSGESADPDYFGRDTGDASKDDPLNGDDIGDKEILVISFGTSFNDSRTATIGGIEKALIQAYPDWSVRRAFTSQIIINHIYARDDERIENVEQAMKRAKDNGVKNLVIQPTHLMHGAEYDELSETVNSYASDFETITISEPLLGEASDDASILNEDKKKVAVAVTEAAVDEAGYDSLDAANKDGTAFVFLGHGTSHKASVAYDQMNSQMKELKYDNVFIGTVEGEPEDTECEAVLNAIREKGYNKVIMRPLMVVAGDHANNDMAGDDEDSWKSVFSATGAFEKIDFQIRGLGEIPGIQEIYVSHLKTAIENSGVKAEAKEGGDKAALPEGGYEAEFKTDSTMFRVNEAKNGKGLVTEKDGKLTIHISLVSKNIEKLYPGLAKDAEKADTGFLEPTIDSVTYSDGTTDEVYGFDVPVPALNEEFDLAILGKKGKWYDHKVRVIK